MEKIDRSKWGGPGRDVAQGDEVTQDNDKFDQIADKVDEIVDYINDQDQEMKEKLFELAGGMSEFISKIPTRMKPFIDKDKKSDGHVDENPDE